MEIDNPKKDLRDALRRVDEHFAAEKAEFKTRNPPTLDSCYQTIGLLAEDNYNLAAEVRRLNLRLKGAAPKLLPCRCKSDAFF